jgi:glycerol-3-phosphate O-acyltransferase
MDIYRLLRTGGKEDNLTVKEVCDALDRLVTQVRKLVAQGEIRMDDDLQNLSTEATLESALVYFQVYHTRPVLYRRGDRLYPGDHNLLYYYHNRLQSYGLEKWV